MEPLSFLREQWKSIDSVDIDDSSGMTKEESLQIWLDMQHTFIEQLRQTEDLFGEDHRDALRVLQARLIRLNQIR